MQLSNHVKTSIAITPTEGAAAKTAIEGATLDMQGFEAFRVVLVAGAITAGAVTSMKVQQGDADPPTTDLEGSSVTIPADGDDKVFISDVFKPTKRYVRVYVSRATQDAAVASALYEQYGASAIPITEGDNVTVEKHVSPDEGTA